MSRKSPPFPPCHLSSAAIASCAAFGCTNSTSPNVRMYHSQEATGFCWKNANVAISVTSCDQIASGSSPRNVGRPLGALTPAPVTTRMNVLRACSSAVASWDAASDMPEGYRRENAPGCSGLQFARHLELRDGRIRSDCGEEVDRGPVSAVDVDDSQRAAGELARPRDDRASRPLAAVLRRDGQLRELSAAGEDDAEAGDLLACARGDADAAVAAPRDRVDRILPARRSVAEALQRREIDQLLVADLEVVAGADDLGAVEREALQASCHAEARILVKAHRAVVRLDDFEYVGLRTRLAQRRIGVSHHLRGAL